MPAVPARNNEANEFEGVVTRGRRPISNKAKMNRFLEGQHLLQYLPALTVLDLWKLHADGKRDITSPHASIYNHKSPRARWPSINMMQNLFSAHCHNRQPLYKRRWRCERNGRCVEQLSRRCDHSIGAGQALTADISKCQRTANLLAHFVECAVSLQGEVCQ